MKVGMIGKLLLVVLAALGVFALLFYFKEEEMTIMISFLITSIAVSLGLLYLSNK